MGYLFGYRAPFAGHHSHNVGGAYMRNGGSASLGEAGLGKRVSSLWHFKWLDVYITVFQF